MQCSGLACLGVPLSVCSILLPTEQEACRHKVVTVIITVTVIIITTTLVIIGIIIIPNRIEPSNTDYSCFFYSSPYSGAVVSDRKRRRGVSFVNASIQTRDFPFYFGIMSKLSDRTATWGGFNADN